LAPTGERGTNSVRLCLAGLALTLAGCPQLFQDDFATVRPARDVVLADAGIFLQNAGRAASVGGGGGNAAGGTATEPDAAGAGAGGAGGSAADASSGGSADTTLVARDPPDAVVALGEALAHRYRFEGTGTSAIDGIAAANGALAGTTLSGLGYVSLSTGSFVNLPNGLLSASNDRTIETWVVWNGGAIYQRIFDLGSSDGGEDARGVGASYVSLTPDAGQGVLQVLVTTSGLSALQQFSAASALPVGTLTHVAVVIDSATNSLALYVAGQLDTTFPLTTRLSEINDVNDWLGQAQVSVHPALNGQIHEFRIYDQALSAAQLALSFQLGPDTTELRGF